MNPGQEKSFELTVAAFESIKLKLPEKDIKEVSSLIFENNEWGIGLEHIMFTLRECKISVTQSEHEAIAKAFESIGIEIEPDW